MRKIGTFFGGVLIFDGFVGFLLSQANPSIEGGTSFAFGMFLIGALIALASLGRIIKDIDQSWLSWVFGIIGGVIFAAFYASWIVLRIILAFVPGSGSARSSVAKVTERQFSASNKTKEHYDSTGNYTGKTTKDGKRYDQHGKYTGKTTKDGKRYDQHGKYTGKTTKDGKRYDQHGKYVGKSTKDGTRYDKSGKYSGKTIEK